MLCLETRWSTAIVSSKKMQFQSPSPVQPLCWPQLHLRMFPLLLRGVSIITVNTKQMVSVHMFSEGDKREQE